MKHQAWFECYHRRVSGGVMMGDMFTGVSIVVVLPIEAVRE